MKKVMCTFTHDVPSARKSFRLSCVESLDLLLLRNWSLNSDICFAKKVGKVMKLLLFGLRSLTSENVIQNVIVVASFPFLQNPAISVSAVSKSKTNMPHKNMIGSNVHFRFCRLQQNTNGP